MPVKREVYIYNIELFFCGKVCLPESGRDWRTRSSMKAGTWKGQIPLQIEAYQLKVDWCHTSTIDACF